VRSFARSTHVSADRTRVEIEEILARFGASSFGYMTDVKNRVATIGFEAKGLHIMMKMALPDRDAEEFTMRPSSSKARPVHIAEKAYQDEVRRRWRCLCLLVKAKMVAVADRITTFEDEFMPYIVTGSGATVSEVVTPMLSRHLNDGSKFLLSSGPDR